MFTDRNGNDLRSAQGTPAGLMPTDRTGRRFMGRSASYGRACEGHLASLAVQVPCGGTHDPEGNRIHRATDRYFRGF